MRGGVQMGSSSSKSLTIEDVEAIAKNCPSVRVVSPEVRSNGQVIYANKNAPTSIYGGNENYLKIKVLSVKEGREFTQKEISTAAKVCLIGKTVISNICGENADPVGQIIRSIIFP
jgi:putative ABC transport system permease protein